MIIEANEKDAPELEKLISKEFAYKGLSSEKIIERLKSHNIRVFKKVLNGKIEGFVEIEFQGKNAIINAISVSGMERGKGYGEELFKYAVNFIRESGVEKAELLVKKGNAIAKSLYKKMGFRFAKFHNRAIDGSVAEVWEKEFVHIEKYLN